MVYSGKLSVLTPQGDLKILLDEGDPAKVDALETAFFRNRVTEDVLFASGGGIAPWMASVTFGGPDLRTVYVGSLKGKLVPYFASPVDGRRWSIGSDWDFVLAPHLGRISNSCGIKTGPLEPI